MNASRDTRSFVYALEPLLKLQTWQCDSLGVKLAMLHRDIARADAEQRVAEQRFEERLEQLRDFSRRPLDTYSYRQQLDYLGQQQLVLERGRQSLSSLHEQKRTLMTQYAQAQRKAESIVGHKEEQQEEHLQLAQNRQQSEDDRAWIARRLWTNFS